MSMDEAKCLQVSELHRQTPNWSTTVLRLLPLKLILFERCEPGLVRVLPSVIVA